MGGQALWVPDLGCVLWISFWCCVQLRVVLYDTLQCSFPFSWDKTWMWSIFINYSWPCLSDHVYPRTLMRTSSTKSQSCYLRHCPKRKHFLFIRRKFGLKLTCLKLFNRMKEVLSQLQHQLHRVMEIGSKYPIGVFVTEYLVSRCSLV